MRCSIASTFWRRVSHSVLTGALDSRFMVRPPCWDGPSPSPGHWLFLTLMLDLTHFLLFPQHWPSFDRATLPVASGGTVFERLLSWEFTCLKLSLFHPYASLIVWAYDSRLKCIFPRIQKPSASNFQCYCCLILFWFSVICMKLVLSLWKFPGSFPCPQCSEISWRWILA